MLHDNDQMTTSTNLNNTAMLVASPKDRHLVEVRVLELATELLDDLNGLEVATALWGKVSWGWERK
jgi:hypothetical protein